MQNYLGQKYLSGHENAVYHTMGRSGSIQSPSGPPGFIHWVLYCFVFLVSDVSQQKYVEVLQHLVDPVSMKQHNNYMLWILPSLEVAKKNQNLR